MILSGPCSWVRAGRGVAARGKQGGWLVLWCLACVVGAGVGLVAWCWHRRHARCGGLLGLLWSWWSAVVGAPLVGGGMLSGFWGSAPWLPGPCSAACWWVVGCGCGWVGCELYSGREHLTVSLRQVFCFVVCCVVCFYERSVDALASGADEGRGGLRYSSGSRLAGCDPRVSEWGDPARVMSCHLHLNCIGCGG